MIRQTICVAALFALAGCSTVADLPTERIGAATLSLANGVPVGTARLHAAGDTVTLTVGLTGIPGGTHGVHLHTTGKCERPEFASAGGHLNPAGRHHGTMAPGGSHFGDLPNVTIGAGRTGSMTADLKGTRAETLGWIFDADGTAIVVHAGPDDYKTDPTGDSGARIACGVLTPA